MSEVAQETRRYDVFISYRQEGLDKRVADELSRLLRSYRTPRDLVRKGAPRKIEVFMDREELSVGPNLNGKITDALERSRYLVVLCSPRTCGTEWVEQEIRTFKNLSPENASRVFAVLVEGEKGEVFPGEIYGVAAEGRTEPLAFDVTAESTRGCIRRLRDNRFALIAPLVGVDRADLERREQKRFARQMITAVVTMGVATAVFAALFLYAQKQRNAAIRERDRAENNRQIANQALERWTRQSGVSSGHSTLDRVTDLEIKEVDLNELVARDPQSLPMLESLVAVRTEKVAAYAQLVAESGAGTDTLALEGDREALSRCMLELKDTITSAAAVRSGRKRAEKAP